MHSSRFGKGMTAAAIASLLAASATGIVNVARTEDNRETALSEPLAPSPATIEPEPQPTTDAPTEEHAEPPRQYTIRPGDSLSAIAEAQLGAADKWPNLYGANLNAVGDDPNALIPGTVLELREGEAPQIATAPVPEPYANNLDGWIREALAVMHYNGIPGTYDGIHRNIIRESGGDPHALNDWDSNAAAGMPSKGLLQTIDPTFNAYHVTGTSWNPYDPVANIVAACNYAANRYGSIDNVDGPY
jgi:hypothetical protein